MAKYLPGNALVLAPFVAAGAPWLWPLLAFGACAALIFVAARQSGAPVAAAVFGAAAFAASKLDLLLFPTFLSHCTSTLAALGALVFATRRRPLAAGACVGFALLTRPYTAIACAIALGVVLLLQRARPGQFLAAGAPILAAAAIAAGFNAATTGSWRTTAWQLYAKQYSPADGPGFGPVEPSATPPRRPWHLQPLLEQYDRDRIRYTLPTLPRHALLRVDQIVDYLPLRALAVLALLGLGVAAEPSIAFALTWLLALFALNLTFHAEAPQYHADEYAPLLLLVVAGLTVALRGTRRPALVVAALAALQLAFYAFFWNVSTVAAIVLIAVLAAAAILRQRGALLLRASAAVLAAVACVQMPYRVAEVAPARSSYDPVRVRFARLLDSLRPQHAILFVRGTPDQMLELPLTNPGLGVADVEPIVAVDQGARDRELLALYPDRRAWLLEAGAWTVQELSR